MAVVWVIAPCSLVEIYQRYTEDLAASIIRALIARMMEAARAAV
jgi:hypothetical protein